MSNVRQIDLPDLVVGVVEDARDLLEAQVNSLKSDLGDRMGDLGTAIKSWLIAVCVAIVTTVLLGVAISATLTELVGLPWYVSLWIVTTIAICSVVALVYRARASGRKATEGATEEVKLAITAGASPDHS
ncbi:MAG: hypothetical protein H0T79_12785 [Deltaproteobacteria bacterium]|nr:hypothetical protein [Deltaproteobacteria bacterium]